MQQAWESQCFGLTQHKTVRVSQMTSVFLFAMYIQYVYFQLVSHKDLFEGGDEEEVSRTIIRSLLRLGLRWSDDISNNLADRRRSR
eukprot:COSAG04_NODE_380_length_15462_cov_2.388401_2_plen_86_part_00